ncbi:MAG: formylmethionine deformylase, partial [Candidatus Omnitrophica bacterium CG11_big_fil_rev_8_21_14_0_20_64_10]
MIFKVARLGHPVLRMKARAVSQAQIAEEPFQQLLEELRQTMVEYDGIGIAAPQVHLSLQIALVGEGAGRYPKAPRLKPTVLINPKVRPIGRRKVTDWEGCLSVPGWRGQVPRWHSV